MIDQWIDQSIVSIIECLTGKRLIKIKSVLSNTQIKFHDHPFLFFL